MSADDFDIEAWLEQQTSEADEELHAELGRLVVGFSEMVGALENQTILAVGRFATEDEATGSPQFLLLEAAIVRGEANAASEAFFAVMAQLGGDDWSDEEWKAVKDLRAKIQCVIKVRNRLAHDTWRLGSGGSSDASGWATYSGGTAGLRRIARSKNGKPGRHQSIKEYDAERLREQLRKVASLVSDIKRLGESTRFSASGGDSPRPSSIIIAGKDDFSD